MLLCAITCRALSLSTELEQRSRRSPLAYVNLLTPSAPRSYPARTLRYAVHFPTWFGPKYGRVAEWSEDDDEDDDSDNEDTDSITEDDGETVM